MSSPFRAHMLGPAILVASATAISCGRRSEVVCATPIPISRESMAAAQAHATEMLRARGYAFYSPAEQMRSIERYDVPLRAHYESFVYAERDLPGVCENAPAGCKAVGVVIVYMVRDEGAGTAGWHALVRAYTSRRSGAEDRFALVPVTREVQADADAIARELRLEQHDVIS